MKTIHITEQIKVGNEEPLLLIAGPCVIENEDFNTKIAEEILKITQKFPINFIFKSSFDKANRTSINSFRGVEMQEGLRILENIKRKIGVSVLTDIHESSQAKAVAQVCDVLQIPAFLCRQTDLLVAAAETSKCVNVKKGQFLAPWDMKNVVKKLEEAGCERIMLTERGTSFGYNTLVVDMRGLVQMREFGYPVCFDATHSVQMPGGKGETSGGQREFVPVLAKAAAAVGINALFMEVHTNPENAPSDGPNMLYLKDLEKNLEKILKIREATKD